MKEERTTLTDEEMETAGSTRSETMPGDTDADDADADTDDTDQDADADDPS
jgi:hypothetical protein